MAKNKYDWCVTYIPNYKEVCYVECPEDFNIDEINEDFKFCFDKFDDKWHQLTEETQLLILTANDVGIQTITKNNVKGWLTRLSMLQGMYGNFMHNQAPVKGLYMASDVIQELKEKYNDLPKSVGELEEFLNTNPKNVPIPKQLDPMVLMAHIGFSMKVEKKSWQQFCSMIARTAEQLISENIEAIEQLRAEREAENNNKKEVDNED